jgi:hypothetical protein
MGAILKCYDGENYLNVLNRLHNYIIKPGFLIDRSWYGLSSKITSWNDDVDTTYEEVYQTLVKLEI